jgi:hypothetical protein
MKGQWIGRYDANRSGDAVIDIDDNGTHYRGMAYLCPDDKTIPATATLFNIKKGKKKYKLNSDLAYLDSANLNPLDQSTLSTQFPGYTFPTSATTYLELASKNSLIIGWDSEGTKYECKLTREDMTSPSRIKPISSIKTWQAFKDYSLGLKHEEFIFRGQPGPYRLRTSFHRTNRTDLLYYMNNDIPQLHRILSANTSHVFNLSNADQNGAFYNLAQHHGYPTPLLDWSFSPFVAAYFAYRNVDEKDTTGKVKIFILNRSKWQELPQLSKVAPARLHFSLASFVAIENKRMGPQQSISSLTNAEDIERYILHIGEIKGKDYLTAVELPKSAKRIVLRELSIMGITAGSLFPGLDGACEAQREHDFLYTDGID